MDLLSVIDPSALPLAAVKKFSAEIVLWLGLIVLSGVFLGIVAMAIRKRLMTEPEHVPLGFTLADLRKMHALGQLTDEELKRAEDKALAKSRALYLGDAADEVADADGSEDASGGLADRLEDDGPLPGRVNNPAGETDPESGVTDYPQAANEGDVSTNDPPPADGGTENESDRPDKNTDDDALS